MWWIRESPVIDSRVLFHGAAVRGPLAYDHPAQPQRYAYAGNNPSTIDPQGLVEIAAFP